MEASLTQLLNRAQCGDRIAENLAYQLTIGRLRAVAGSLIRSERPGHTLQATALVSEAFLQKLRRLRNPIQDREHFYSLAAYAMRQVLIDHARSRTAGKRVPPDVVADLLGTSRQWTFDTEAQLAVRQAFERLAELDSVAAKTLLHCFVEGRTLHETAAHQGRQVWRVRADCDFGLKWMSDQLDR